MDAGIDHQPRGAPDLVAEHAEALVSALVHPHLETELLAVERPALAVGRDIGELAEHRLILVLHGDRHLKGVPGRRLVQRERGEVVQRAAREVIGVEKVDARSPAARRVERREVLGHRLDGEARARQVAEELPRLAIEALGDPRRPHQELLGRAGVEARIGAQKLEERREIAAEAGLAHGREHRLVQPPHFGDAEPVDFVGIHVEGRELADLGAVVVAPVREVRGRERRAHPGHVLGAHELQQLHIRRLHHLADGLHGLGAQCRLPRGGHARHVLEGGIEETRLGGRVRDRGDGAVPSRHGDARRSEPALHPGAHLVHLLVEVARDIAHLRDPVLVVHPVAERPARGVAEIGPERGVGICRHLEVAEALVRDQRRDLRAVDVVVDLLLRREARPRNGVEPMQHVFPVSEPHLLGRRVHFRQAIGHGAGTVLGVRQLIGAPFPLAGVDGPQPLVSGVLPGLLRAAGERCGDEGGAQCGYQRGAHRVLSTQGASGTYEGVSILEPLRAARVLG